MCFQNAALQMLVTCFMFVSIANSSTAGATVTPPCDAPDQSPAPAVDPDPSPPHSPESQLPCASSLLRFLQNAALQMFAPCFTFVSMLYQVCSLAVATTDNAGDGSATPKRRTTADLPVAKEKRKCWVLLANSRKAKFKSRKARRAARIWGPIRSLFNLLQMLATCYLVVSMLYEVCSGNDSQNGVWQMLAICFSFVSLLYEAVAGAGAATTTTGATTGAANSRKARRAAGRRFGAAGKARAAAANSAARKAACWAARNARGPTSMAGTRAEA